MAALKELTSRLLKENTTVPWEAGPRSHPLNTPQIVAPGAVSSFEHVVLRSSVLSPSSFQARRTAVSRSSESFTLFDPDILNILKLENCQRIAKVSATLLGFLCLG